MVFTRKEKNQPKKQLSQLNETLNESIIGSSTNVNAVEQQTLEQRTNDPNNDFERFNNSSRQDQVTKNNIDHKIRREIHDAVLTVKNHPYDVISTAMDKMVIPRVQTAVRLITGLTGHGSISDVQNPDRTDS